MHLSPVVFVTTLVAASTFGRMSPQGRTSLLWKMQGGEARPVFDGGLLILNDVNMTWHKPAS